MDRVVSVRPFPDGEGVEWEVATNAWEPLWSHDGRELFYRTREQVIAVEVVPGPTFTMGQRRVLFPNAFRMNVNRQQWDVGPDDERFVVIGGWEGQDSGDPRAAPEELIVVENFFEELKLRVRPR